MSTKTGKLTVSLMSVSLFLHLCQKYLAFILYTTTRAIVCMKSHIEWELYTSKCLILTDRATNDHKGLSFQVFIFQVLQRHNRTKMNFYRISITTLPLL